MIKIITSMKIRTKLTFLILITGIISYSLFQFLWYNRWTAYGLINSSFHFAPPYGNEYLFDELLKEAVKYDIPKSEEAPLLYAKLALRENGLPDYVDAMNEFN